MDDPIKARILALMSKTTENGCTEEEAMAASQKVQELLNKYQLSLSDIKIKESKCTKGKYDTGLKAHPAIFHAISSIGKFTDTKVWYDLRGGDDGKIAYKFFGLEHDVIIAEYITKVCDWAIIYAGEDFKGTDTYARCEKSKRSKVLGEFRNAMAMRLGKRLREMKDLQERQNASDGRSLVVLKGTVVTEEWAKLNMRLGKAKASNIKFTNAEAYHAGTSAGDRVALNPGVNARGTTAQEKLT